MKKVSFIIHGKHIHRKARLAEIRKTFSADYEIDIRFTEARAHAINLAREAALARSEFIITVAGDGTLNEVANGIMQSRNKEVYLGLLPAGTGNDFARTLKITTSISDLKKLVDLQSAKTIDLGLMSFVNEFGTPSERYFINIADVGIGGIIAQKLSHSSRILGATLTFQKAIIGTFLSFKHQTVKSKAGGFEYEGKILSYIMANGKYFGAGMGIAPDADPADGTFAVVIGANISLWDYLLNLGRVKKCVRIAHPQMKYLSAKDITVESEEKLPVDMDGEFIGYTPVRVKMVPGALRFLCPL